MRLTKCNHSSTHYRSYGKHGKENILGTIAMEDAVFTETNIVGEIESGKYRKGRFAVNYLTPGSQVSKPVNNLPYQLFQQVDRLEKTPATWCCISCI